MKTSIRALGALAAILLGALSGGSAWAGIADNQLVVFGDSLSDPGNHYFIFHQASAAPYLPVPDAPYNIGGHHFSNGPTWVEQLTRETGSPSSGLPALARPGVYSNYAVGRARARPNAPVFAAFDLGTQVGLFLNDARGQAPSGPTYVIWIGSNDIDDALNALQADPSGATSMAIIHDALAATAGNIQVLWAAGARDFLVINIPDVGITPAVEGLGPQASAVATQLSAAYNAGLGQLVAQLQALPQMRLRTFDVFGYLHAVVANPAAFQIADAQTPCLAFFVVANAVCAHPGQRLFWDGIHPTAAGHEIVEEAIERLLRPAHPE